jgi:EAL domain-containing protein (putative c-di-GMP-specific phosphodiesterase class I)
MSQISEAGMPLGKVLVVDDEPRVSMPIRRVLAAAGFEVTLAHSGPEAIKLISQTDFDAILSDIHMPQLDGLQLLRMVRLRDLEVPVLLMTGKPELSTATQAIALGALQYLIKPVEPVTLTTEVARAVRLHHVARLRRDAFRLTHGSATSAEQEQLDARLSRALASIWMAYQPIVHAESSALYGYEALMRSSEPELSIPVAILEAAERLGRLADVGRAVRRAVAVAMPEAPQNALVFVNLHARDLMDDELYALDSPLSAFAPRIVLELTERAALHDMNDVRDRVGVLRRLGYRLALDDLGAGYSGLASFASLEPELVKIDMSLVRDIDTQPVKQTLVAALIAVCRGLGIVAVTEGVETDSERRTLTELGCPLLQGYLLGRPAPGFAAPLLH